MEMTEGEIVRMYRQAGDKGGQIQILAELNQTRRIHIIELLLRNGEEVCVPLKRKGRKKGQVWTKKQYNMALIQRLEELNIKIVELEQEYKEIAAVVKARKE